MMYRLCDCQALQGCPEWTEPTESAPYPKLVVVYDQWGGPVGASYEVEVTLDPSGAFLPWAAKVVHKATGEVAKWAGDILSLDAAPDWVREARDGVLAVLAREGGAIPQAPASWNEEEYAA